MKTTQHFRFLSLVIGLFTVSAHSYAQGTKTPASVAMETQKIQDRFASSLLDECPEGACYSSGCSTGAFTTLDNNQDSSLPGLETSVQGATNKSVQYKLTSARCHFSYEPSLQAQQIKKLRQRLSARVKTVGTQIQITASKLQAKLTDEGSQNENENETWKEKLIAEIFPFLPWLLLLFSVLFASLILIWGIRRLGKPKARIRNTDSRTRSGDGEDGLVPLSEPSSQMLILRTSQLKRVLDEDEKLVEYTLRSHFEEKNFDELCLFLRHFGPSYLNIFKEKAELTELLADLSQKYSEFDRPETPSEHWTFLDRLERKITSAQVKINNQPLIDEFAFLGSINVDELLGLLKNVTDLEAVAAIAYAPILLREEFFAIAPPALTSKVVEQLTKVDRLPDSFVRETAEKLRTYYNDNSKDLKTVKVNRTPLLEMALNNLDEPSRKQLIDELRRDNPAAIKELAPAIFLDESLRFLDSDLITEVFLEVPPRDAAAYLQKFEWKNEISKSLNEKLGAAINKHLNNNHHDEAGASRARVRIAKFVRAKASSGALDLTSINKKILD